MTLAAAFYVVNAALLLLHEIDSAYEKEWEILHLPGGISGFLVLHAPLVLLLFWGALEISRQSQAGLVLGLVVGIGGTIPFLVHEVLVKRAGHFSSWTSRAVIYLNGLTGLVTAVLSAQAL